MPAPIVFFDIAAPKDANLSTFYSEIFDWDIDEKGNVSVQIISSVDGSNALLGAIRQDPSEKLLYLGVDDITATLQKIVEYGGSIDQPRFEVPGLVVLGLFKDPAGNRQGLVELDNGKIKIP